MPAKHSLKFEYKSPFITFFLYGNQKDYRMAWLLNKQMDIELERINDFPFAVSSNEVGFVLYKYYCNNYRMSFFLLQNKNGNRIIINQTPAPDYLFLIWNKSEFFDVDKFIKEARKTIGLQAVFPIDQKREEKQRAFFHDLEYFLEENEEI